ncbi:MAG: molybdopterin-dependent oxidoreductase, partial [Clostridia bacterium]|nr:molybdopterin-dependent oxidoreductase [Clostridia bacterium]
ITLACMTGNIGIPGAGVGLSVHNRAGNAGPPLVRAGSSGVPSIDNPLKDVRINQNELWEACLSGKYTAGKDDIRNIDIRMVYFEGMSVLNQKPGAVKGIKAMREKFEFVVTNAYNLTTQAKFSDIVLPVTTPWEKFGSFGSGNREALFYYTKAIEPWYESKDDIWVAAEVGKRLGLDPKLIDPLSIEQQVFNQLAGAQVVTPDGSGMEKLVTITAQDIKEWGVEGTPQQGRITIKEFAEKGCYQVPRSPGDNYGFTEFEDYRNDPEKYPRSTPSKKIEIHCQSLADKITNYGWTVKSPIAKYDPPEEGYEDTFADWEKKIKGEYPFQLYTIHYRRRSHSIFDNVPWLREAFPQEFIMNADDGKALGLKDGDIVKITSRHGSVLRPVYLTERMMPGVVTLGEGAWIELDEETGIDKAGNVNMLNGDIPTGQGHLGANSCVVKVEKYDKPLPPDAEWPQRIIF